MERTRETTEHAQLVCFILCEMLVEAKQNEEVTRVSQKMDSLFTEIEGTGGNLVYSAMTRCRVLNGREKNAEHVRTDRKW